MRACLHRSMGSGPIDLLRSLPLGAFNPGPLYCNLASRRPSYSTEAGPSNREQLNYDIAIVGAGKPSC